MAPVSIKRLVLACIGLLLPVLAWGNTYDTKCAMCHGQDGVGKMPGVPNLAQRKLTRQQIISVINNGKGKMPRINIDPEQAGEAAQYILDKLQK